MITPVGCDYSGPLCQVQVKRALLFAALTTTPFAWGMLFVLETDSFKRMLVPGNQIRAMSRAALAAMLMLSEYG